jgi:hypothetical protein
MNYMNIFQLNRLTIKSEMFNHVFVKVILITIMITQNFKIMILFSFNQIKTNEIK